MGKATVRIEVQSLGAEATTLDLFRFTHELAQSLARNHHLLTERRDGDAILFTLDTRDALSDEAAAELLERAQTEVWERGSWVAQRPDPEPEADAPPTPAPPSIHLLVDAKLRDGTVKRGGCSFVKPRTTCSTGWMVGVAFGHVLAEIGEVVVSAEILAVDGDTVSLWEVREGMVDSAPTPTNVVTVSRLARLFTRVQS